MDRVAKKLLYDMRVSKDYQNLSVEGDVVVIFNSGAGFSVFKDISLFLFGVWYSDNHVFVIGGK